MRLHTSRWTPFRVSALLAALALGSVLTAALLTDRNDNDSAATGTAGAGASIDLYKQYGEDRTSQVVGWSDQVVFATAIKEEELPGTTRRTDDGSLDGLVMRQVTFEVTSRPWHRPGLRPVPDEFSVTTWGWVIREQTRAPFRPTGETYFEIGQEYMIPIALDGHDWRAFTAASFPVVGDVVTPGPDQQTPFAQQVVGLQRSALTPFFRSAEPSREIAPYVHLPLRKRYQAVMSPQQPKPSRTEPSTPTP